MENAISLPNCSISYSKNKCATVTMAVPPRLYLFVEEWAWVVHWEVLPWIPLAAPFLLFKDNKAVLTSARKQVVLISGTFLRHVLCITSTKPVWLMAIYNYMHSVPHPITYKKLCHTGQHVNDNVINSLDIKVLTDDPSQHLWQIWLFV